MNFLVRVDTVSVMGGVHRRGQTFLMSVTLSLVEPAMLISMNVSATPVLTLLLALIRQQTRPLVLATMSARVLPDMMDLGAQTTLTNAAVTHASTMESALTWSKHIFAIAPSAGTVTSVKRKSILAMAQRTIAQFIQHAYTQFLVHTFVAVIEVTLSTTLRCLYGMHRRMQ